MQLVTDQGSGRTYIVLGKVRLATVERGQEATMADLFEAQVVRPVPPDDVAEAKAGTEPRPPGRPPKKKRKK